MPPPSRFISPVPWLGALALLPWLGALATAAADRESPSEETAWEVTAGAAPGYLDDAACEPCHQAIFASYQEVAMSKAFYPPSADGILEKLGEPFRHELSDRIYEMSWFEGGYRFKRYQLDDAGSPINVLEQDVDWILGSGNHSRTYLFRTPGGELFQLPLAWYSQTDSWGMAPGYDRPTHLGVQRLVRRECMFCHNAYPDVAVGDDAYDAPHRFPAELPSGLGCQRCHGPGGLHASLARSADLDLALAAIVNPGKLAPERRNDICYGCHLQPSVSLHGVRRFGRPVYSFRPGQSLADYQVHLDVVEEGKERHERFEINHHPYRLEQSRCFLESADLNCLTCHDPHRKVPAAERPNWYGARCLGCHELAATEAHAGEDPGYCVPCHMPERRTQDVIQVTMTDHLIQRGPPEAERLAPLAERDPIIVDARYLYPERAPAGPLAEIYRATTVVRVGGGANASAVARLEQLLAEEPLPQIEPWLNLAAGQLGQNRPAAVEPTARALFERSPEHPLGLDYLGLAFARQGRNDEAIELIRRAASASPPRPESLFNLGLLLAGAGRPSEALAALERALEIRPPHSVGWYYKAEVLNVLERPRDAVAAYRRALELDPGLDRAYVALGDTLLDLGRRAEALRYLRHGTRAARDRGLVAAALERVAALPPD